MNQRKPKSDTEMDSLLEGHLRAYESGSESALDDANEAVVQAMHDRQGTETVTPETGIDPLVRQEAIAIAYGGEQLLQSAVDITPEQDSQSDH